MSMSVRVDECSTFSQSTVQLYYTIHIPSQSRLQYLTFETLLPPPTLLPSHSSLPSLSHPIHNYRLRLPTRTQRPIEPSHTIHILPILRLLLFPDRIDIVPRYLGILGRFEPCETHHEAHLGHFRIRIFFFRGFRCVKVSGSWSGRSGGDRRVEDHGVSG